jgi:hypothetical protein
VVVVWLAILAVLAIFVAAQFRRKGAPLPLELRLRLQILRRLRGPVSDAEAILERTLRGVRQRHPDKDERWCLRRVLADLDKDRR